MAWLFFIDESGHDHRHMPTSARGSPSRGRSGHRAGHARLSSTASVPERITQGESRLCGDPSSKG